MTSSAPSSRRLTREALEARLDDALLASQSHRSTDDEARGLEDLPRAQQELVLHWVTVAAQTYTEIGYLIASLAPRALQLLDAEGFAAWALAGLDAYDREGARAAVQVLRALDAFAAARQSTRAAEFASVEPRLSRLLQGLAGRPLGLRVAEAAWTDTETIFLPPRLDRFPAAEENRRLYKATAVLLWAQTRYGTFGSAEIDLQAALARWGESDRARAWFAALEALRLEAALAAELAGLTLEIARLRGPWPPEVAAFAPRLARAGATLADSLAALEECMAGDMPAPALPHAGRIDPAAALAVRAKRIERDTRVLRQALSGLKGIGRPGPEDGVERPALNAEGGAAEALTEGEIGALPPEARAAAQSLVQDLGQIPPECLVPAGPGAYRPDARPPGGGESVLPPPCDYRYDEWDYHRRAYRRLWCHLYEHDVLPGAADYVDEVRRRHAGLIAQTRRRFEALRAETRMLGRQMEGEEIDVDAQVEARTDRRSGVEPSPRLFCRRLRRERSLAAMFMVDMSGSTRGWVNDAEREALIMLCEALETLGDAYAIYGFSGWTRTRCDIYRIKDFAETYDGTVRARIAAIEAKDYTRMGVAVRHLTALLLRQPARHRLLVTLSDGRPDDFGDEYRGQYGIEDTRRALQEAHAASVRGYCVTIDRQGADYLAHMYGPAGYTVLDDVKKLPLKVADIYRRLTT